MESSLWRVRCRTVAWANIGFTSLLTFILSAHLLTPDKQGLSRASLYFLYTLTYIDNIFQKIPNEQLQYEYISQFFRWLIWGLVFMVYLLLISNIIASIQILYSTKRGMDMHTELKGSRNWRKFNIVFIFFIIVHFILTGYEYFLLLLVQCLFQFLIAYFVTKFIEELREKMGSVSNSTPLHTVVLKP